ncbi:MAG: hypothetical protein FJ091_19245 [Deltaproteobacteria bacterium]|nr:hypothetical protein [Deltaproteobacteria bacterium]
MPELPPSEGSKPGGSKWSSAFVDNAGNLVASGLAAAAIGLAGETQEQRSIVQGIGFAVALLGTILLFTRPIQSGVSGSIKANEKTFPPLFRTAYTYGLIAFVMPAVLMFLPDVGPLGSRSLCFVENCGATTPIGGQVGRDSRAAEAEADAALPAEVPDIASDEAAETTAADENVAQDPPAGVSGNESSPNGRDDDRQESSRVHNGSHDPWAWEPIAILIGCDYAEGEDDSQTDVRGLGAPCGVLEPQWVVSVGGWILAPGIAVDVRLAPAAEDDQNGRSGPIPRACGSESCAQSHVHPISGGVVVPLYFVLIAMLGGSIGLLRKLPEIQFRSEDGYAPASGEPTKLTPNQARDFLLFQLIQLLAAPIIAVVAFSIVEPASATATVVLAFGAGFSSEPFLLMVREYVERISGVTAKKVPLVDGAALIPGRLVRLIADHDQRAAGSVGVVLSLDAAAKLATISFRDPDGVKEESIPLEKLAVG